MCIFKRLCPAVSSKIHKDDRLISRMGNHCKQGLYSLDERASYIFRVWVRTAEGADQAAQARADWLPLPGRA